MAKAEIHQGLNMNENWNGANDFILQGKGGKFASNRVDLEEMTLSLRHLQIRLVYVNTLGLQPVLTEPEWQERLTPTNLRAFSTSTPRAGSP